jgi:hypothetical protein
VYVILPPCKSFQLAIVLFLDQKFKIYMGGGAKFLKGAIFRGAIFLGDSPRGGGESPVTPVPYYRENSTLKPWLKIINYRTLGFGNIFPSF